jgi:imidazolonepropionase-like amidohydrolase
MLAVRAGKLIDGSGAEPRLDAVILIDGERIKEVGEAKEITIPPTAEVLDATSMTVIPGMIDCHVHVHGKGGPSKDHAADQITHSRAYLTLRSYRNCMRDLEMGFTTIRNGHSPGYQDVAVRDAVNDGLIQGPRVLACGQGLTVTGGHMDKGTWAQEVTQWGRTGVCDGPWDCRRAAREQFKRGADLIKINAAGGSYEDLSVMGIQQMTYEEMAAICEEAHWAGKKVMAHAHGGPGITDAIRAGLDSVEHGVCLSKEQAEMMAEHGVFHVPTLSTHTRGVELGPEDAGCEGAVWDWLVHVAEESMWRALDYAKEAGVGIVVGTDAGFWMYHGENAKELEELVRGGFTPMEAIVAATKTGAECLGLEDDIGTVEVGKYADLVVVNGDPLADVGILQDEEKIVQVLKGGKSVK